jgi:lysozyme family protein
MPTFVATKVGYANLWAAARVLPVWQDRARVEADRIKAGMARYEAVSHLTGVPALLIGLLHKMESGCDFRTHLHNGDSLTRRTVHVPKGRPQAAPANGRSYTWEESAVDALAIKGLVGTGIVWTVPRMLYEAERYNGWGYTLYHNINSPYVWSGTTLQQRGLYVADGKWDASSWSKQVGVAAILKLLKGENMIDFLQQFDRLAPALVGAMTGRYAGIASMVLHEALEKTLGIDVPDGEQAIFDRLKQLKYSEVSEVLAAAEKVLKPLVDVKPIEPEHEPPTLAIEPLPPVQPMPIDVLLGRGLTGYKTYIVIALAGVVNVAAALGIAPTILTPEVLVAANTLFSALGGAALVSKIERYAHYAAVLRR